MTEAKSFNCPNCGSPLMPNGEAKEVKCAFCGSIVIVPVELRDQHLDKHQKSSPKLKPELSPEEDFFSHRHVDWLIQNGADATAKVEVVKDTGETKNMNPVVILQLSGKKAGGGKFDGIASINVPRSAIPRRGTTIKIKYNPNYEFSDFALQIDGQFYYHSYPK
jgi:LSD1 subclass zinc finger protein